MTWVQQYQGLIGLGISLAVSTVVAVIALLFRSQVQRLVGDRASAEELAKVATQVDDVDRRVMAVEARLLSLPTAEQMGGLALRIESLAGDMKAVVAQLAGTNELLRAQIRKSELLDEFLHRRDG